MSSQSPFTDQTGKKRTYAASQCARNAPLSPPSNHALDRVGASLRHGFANYNGKASPDHCASDFRELLRELG